MMISSCGVLMFDNELLELKCIIVMKVDGVFEKVRW